MRLNRLVIDNFKNITSADLEFSPKVNCFLGNNGMGKSNLLDAVYYLSFCRSFSGVTDSLIMRRGSDFLTLRGEYLRSGSEETLRLGMGVGRRKSFRRGDKEYQRLSSHIGLFPLVMVAPQDIDLVRDTPEVRRRWLDMVISQSDAAYLDRLIRYGHALEQRNRLLRDGVVDHTLYSVIEMQMESAAGYIADTRERMVRRLSDIFGHYYRSVAGNEAEKVSLFYEGWRKDLPGQRLTQMLDGCRRHDEAVRHTSVGPHRDDIAMTLDGMAARRTGSQGQCKTFTVALRLAQYAFLRESTGLRPLLLLDDIFDKLDATRVERIMELVTSDDFGQIFITDTNRKHLDTIIGRTGGDHRLWTVDNGCFTPSPHTA